MIKTWSASSVYQPLFIRCDIAIVLSVHAIVAYDFSPGPSTCSIEWFGYSRLLG
jgi:hypothetical protein